MVGRSSRGKEQKLAMWEASSGFVERNLLKFSILQLSLINSNDGAIAQKGMSIIYCIHKVVTNQDYSTIVFLILYNTFLYYMSTFYATNQSPKIDPHTL